MIQLTDKITVKLIDKMGDDTRIAIAAKVSVGIEPDADLTSEKVEGLINYLMKHRHGTPFEHGAVTFYVHAPIFVWREWHRHRVGFSYNEESARYKQLNPVFWIPKLERKIVPDDGHTSARPKFKMGTAEQHKEVVHQLSAAYDVAYNAYQHMLTAGIAKEVARACLPVAIYSSCWVTCNPRSLMHFLSLRTHEPTATFVSNPQAEIEEAARAAEMLLAGGWPITYKAFCNNGRVGP